MKLLAIDGSLKSSGFAVFDDSKLIKYGNIPTDKKDFKDERSRRLFILSVLKNIIDEYEITHIAIEYPYIGRNSNGAIQLTMLVGMVDGMAFVRNIPFTTYRPTQWRKILLGLGKGKIDKLECARHIQNNYYDIGEPSDKQNKRKGIVKNDDIYDAIGIGISYLKEMGGIK